MQFVGRKKELEELNLLLNKNSASLVVIRGRRRIGKSRLINEFVKNYNNWIFSWIPPVKGITKQRQIDGFVKQISENLKLPKLQMTEWSEIFSFLATYSQDKKHIIVFDEISWMGSKDPDFLGYLKNAWDLHFSKNKNLILILCGSVSSWIEENILSSTGFLGRISIDMVLDELSIAEAQKFWGKQKDLISGYEKFKILAVTGGVPKYLEEIIPQDSAESNIQRLCFNPNGLLFREFDQIFSDLFSKKLATYKKIVELLAKKDFLDLNEICKSLKIYKSGNISKYLKNLELAGFIVSNVPWSIKTNKKSSLKKFRLKDNYVGFYLKYIKPNRNKILQKMFESKSLSNLPGWESIMGLHFENLVLSNVKQICKLLKIDLNDVVMIGPFFQRQALRQKGCQIDLLIQTNYYNLYVCEIKFSISEIKKTIVDEVKDKIKNLSYPKGFSIRPILIHVNGVSQAVVESGFFNQIIDFSELFKSEHY